MIVTRTIKTPIHHRTTKRKYSYLDRITTRLTHAVRIWSQSIEDYDLHSAKDCVSFEKEVRYRAGLSSAFVQQARDKALWMWKQYRSSHEKWEKILSRAKKDTKWYIKLKKREPSKPYTSKSSRLKKIPIRFDYRTGIVEKADLELTDWIISISTLKKYEKIIILLNLSNHHKQKLERADKICSFEIVKYPERTCKYMVHITCQHRVNDQPIKTIRGVDLGIKRDIASVKLPLTLENFSLVESNEVDRLKELNDRIAHLRRKEKWEVLKKLRSKRYHLAIDYDRKTAKFFVKEIKEELVVIGNPEYIRYHKFKGNGNKQERRLLQHWSFSRQTEMIIQKCEEKGIKTLKINEYQTSSKCHNCGKLKLKENKRRIECKECGLQYDRDFNSCINIIQKASSYLDMKPFLRRRGLQMNQPEHEMIRLKRPISHETIASIDAPDFSLG